MGEGSIEGWFTAKDICLGVIRLGCEPSSVVNVIYNDPATVVIWDDGSKTVVKCQEGDIYDPRVGLLMCFAKKLFGNTGRYNDVIREWSVLK